MDDDCSDHRPNNEEPKQDQQAGHNAANDLYSMRLERFANRKSSCHEGSLWEDKGEPGHGKWQRFSDTRPMCANRDKEPP